MLIIEVPPFDYLKVSAQLRADSFERLVCLLEIKIHFDGLVHRIYSCPPPNHDASSTQLSVGDNHLFTWVPGYLYDIICSSSAVK